ncbi:Ser/Thr protein phosphatase family protein [Aspergillus terreus]|uniref:Ser/Thr protein phosphatase family protein n=1 Tax=Aspergillus terreus TaxID=33178 RepID=A0A5M3YYG5_ASPTE|nr:hypothetical protein ATETN484_0006017600 [Aspergillus terreus]GFF19917.1 Ser/Thr protein phosphatase family protein [Aspergillus terreus]
MVKTRLCLLSDTHTFPPSTDNESPYRHPLPKADILLHAGDLTKVGRRDEHLAMLAMLRDADAELKIVIAGNHDITLDPDYYASVGHLRHRYRTDHLAGSPTPRRRSSARAHKNNDGDGEEAAGDGPLEDPAEIRALYTGDEARGAGIRYMDEGMRTFFLSNGARCSVYASPYTPEFCRWAFAYDRSVDRFNPPETSAEGTETGGSTDGVNPVPDFPDVDIVLTHGPPYGVHDQVVGTHESVGCEHLFRAVRRARPRLHVFGHIHEGYGATRWEWSTSNESLIQVGRETALADRGAYVDVSGDAANPLRVGDETLFVNASVVTVQYEPVNAPWIVDLDLPPK